MADEDASKARVPRHDSLPLPDYDHLPLEAVRQRIRALSSDELQQVLAYEKAHAGRLLVIQTMEARLQELADGGSPTQGSPDAVAPERSQGASGGSKITPETAGPPVNPPSHGTPQNPAQPR